MPVPNRLPLCLKVLSSPVIKSFRIYVPRSIEKNEKLISVIARNITSRMCCLLIPSSGILILVPLFMIIYDIPIANCKTQTRSLWDDCEKGKGDYLCGNVCVKKHSFCSCGNSTLHYEYTPTLHCCTKGPCFLDDSEQGRCPKGQVTDITKPCDNRKCYANYEDSYSYKGLAKQNFVSYSKSFLSCPLREECLAVNEMCQGHSDCGDHRLCNETLLCDNDKGGWNKSVIRT